MFIVPSLHPSHILRNNAKLAGTIEHALSKAVGLAYSKWKPKWSEAEFDLKPNADSIVAGLGRMAGTAVAFDVETDGKHPLECRLRCVGFYNGTHGVIVPLLYRDGSREDVPVMDRDGEVSVENRAVWKPYFQGAELAKVLAAVNGLLCGAPVISQAQSTVKKTKALTAKAAGRAVKKAKKAAGKQKFTGATATGPQTWADANAEFKPSSLQAALVYTQNGQYDRLVLRASLGLDIKAGITGFTFDTMVAHHVIASYLPHRLGFLAPLYTDAPFYKSNEEGEAWSAGTDIELWRYCLRDCKATWLGGEKMRSELTEAFPTAEQVFLHDMWQEDMCERWKRTGIELDRTTLRYYRHHYVTVRTKALAAMQGVLAEIGVSSDNENFKALLLKLADKADEEIEVIDADGMQRTVEAFNPASLIELRYMLNGLGIPLTELTATGQLSTAKELLTAARKSLLAQKVLPNDPRIAFMDYLFAWRESAKVVGTYLRPEVGSDGRVHPNFNVHVVPTGRLSSSGPNFQNQPAEIRGMFVAREGHVLISMDWDALEMRLGAFLSGDPAYIEVFRKYDAKTGPKPHLANMAAIFKLPATQEAADQNPGMYRAAKVFAYACAYGAGEDTVYEQVLEEMPDMQWADFLIAYANFKSAYPRFFQFQRENIKAASKLGYMDSALLRRRMHFFERAWGESSPEATVMANAPFQSGGADVVSRANRRIEDRVVPKYRAMLRKRGDKFKVGNVWHTCFVDEVIEQLAQVHDELVYEVPERLAEAFQAEMKAVAEEHPTRLDGTVTDWNLPVSSHYARRWKPVQARCGGEVKTEGKDAKGRKVVTLSKCKELVEIEVKEGVKVKGAKGKETALVDCWTGKCKHNHEKVIYVPREEAA